MFKNDKARSAAMADHRVRYDGRPCPRCQATERYTSSGACIRCVSARAVQCAGSKPRYRPLINTARGVALAANKKTFTGHPCITCGATERYTSSGACVHCTKTAQLNPNHRRQSRRETAQAVPQRPTDNRCQCCGKIAPTLVIDHDHDLEELGFPPSETFRGWVCYACNAGIGRLGDTVAGVQRALDYLKRKR